LRGGDRKWMSQRKKKVRAPQEKEEIEKTGAQVPLSNSVTGYPKISHWNRRGEQKDIVETQRRNRSFPPEHAD